jgi:hypothetical protein
MHCKHVKVQRLLNLNKLYLFRAQRRVTLDEVDSAYIRSFWPLFDNV